MSDLRKRIRRGFSQSAAGSRRPFAAIFPVAKMQDAAYEDPLERELQETQAQLDALLRALAPADPALALEAAEGSEDPLEAEKQAQNRRIDALIQALTTTETPGAQRESGASVLEARAYVDPLTAERLAKDQRLDEILDALKVDAAGASPVALAREALEGESGDAADLLHVTLGAAALLVLGLLLAAMTKRSERLAHSRKAQGQEGRGADFDYVLLK